MDLLLYVVQTQRVVQKLDHSAVLPGGQYVICFQPQFALVIGFEQLLDECYHLHRELFQSQIIPRFDYKSHNPPALQLPEPRTLPYALVLFLGTLLEQEVLLQLFAGHLLLESALADLVVVLEHAFQ